MTDNDYDYELKAINVHSNILDTKWRVKLYHLNQSGNWDDMGIGHIYIKQEVILNSNRTMEFISKWILRLILEKFSNLN